MLRSSLQEMQPGQFVMTEITDCRNACSFSSDVALASNWLMREWSSYCSLSMRPNETKLTGAPPPALAREKARTGASG